MVFHYNPIVWVDVIDNCLGTARFKQSDMSKEKINFHINNLSEGLDIEVKNWLSGLQSNDVKAKLAKEIIALANNGGGYIFIGFDDEGEGHPEIPPDAGELEAFTQDSIASLVERYVTPPCQCTVEYFLREGSELSHPVIAVPGEHRTPVWAQRGSPDKTTLQKGTMYVRRPGGYSEPAKTQDDWEKVLDRLVKARQIDQFNAFRDIINPPKDVVAAKPDLDQWDKTSLDIWRKKVAKLPDGDGRCHQQGYWTVSFSIEPFKNPTLRELKEFLERESPAYSGWRPFTFIHRAPLKPTAAGDIIQAWLAQDHNPKTLTSVDERADFWRVSRDGTGFLLRPMQEDRESYCSNISPRPQGPSFDWTFPIYRMTEVLKFVEALALKFSDQNAEFNILLNYYRTEGRSLQSHSFKYNLWESASCTQDTLVARLSGVVSDIGVSLEEKIYSLLTPIYEQFDFTELPKTLVDSVVREALSYR